MKSHMRILFFFLLMSEILGTLVQILSLQSYIAMRTFSVRFRPNPKKDKGIIQIPCVSKEIKRN